MKAIRSVLLARDMFGHAIPFNFNKKGETHNTVFGGCISLVLKAFLLVFFAQKTFIMVTRTDNKIGSSLEPTDFEAGKKYNIVDPKEGFMPIIGLSSTTSFGPFRIDFTEMNRYLKIVTAEIRLGKES